MAGRADLNAASAWRLALAERIAPAYAALPGVRAVLLAGSVARGWADRYSDIEMTLVWDTAPTDDARRDVAAQVGTLVNLYPYDDVNAEWSDDVRVAGVEFQVSHRLVTEIEQWLADVVEGYDSALVKQDLIAIIQYARPLHGHDLIAAWRATVADYPDGLAEAMVREHLGFRSRWVRQKLLYRDDRLLLYDDFVQAEKAILLSLIGLNRVYLPHLGFRWMDRLAADLPLAPPDLAARLAAVFRLPPVEAVATLDALIDATISLVETHLPQVDVRDVRADFEATRPLVDGPAA